MLSIPTRGFFALVGAALLLGESRERTALQGPVDHDVPVLRVNVADGALKAIIFGYACHCTTLSFYQFTGDYAGILLYATLHKFGFATRPQSTSAGDGLRLVNARITNAVKCLPPGNKPLPVEVSNCNAYLAAELATLPEGAVLLALGRIAHGYSEDVLLRADEIVR